MARQCNIENMTKLVEALESGEYEQTSRQLRLNVLDGVSAFCCLGVACDLAAKAGVGEWRGEDFLDANDDGANNCRSGAWLTNGVSAWLGLKPGISDEGDSDILSLDHGDFSGMAMNDGGESFTDIAAAIRRDYLS